MYIKQNFSQIRIAATKLDEMSYFAKANWKKFEIIRNNHYERKWVKKCANTPLLPQRAIILQPHACNTFVTISP